VNKFKKGHKELEEASKNLWDDKKAELSRLIQLVASLLYKS